MLAILAEVAIVCLGALPGSELYALAYRAESAGRVADAVNAYEQSAAAGGPLAPYARVRAAAARTRAGDQRGALEALQKVLSQDATGPWTAFAQFQLGVIYNGARARDEATKLFLSSLDTDAPLWWLDEYRRVAALAYIETPDSATHGFAHFRNVVETTRYIVPRGQAAKELARSNDLMDLVLAVDGLYRGDERVDAAKLLNGLMQRAQLTPQDSAAVNVAAARVAIGDGRIGDGEELLRRVPIEFAATANAPKAYAELVRANARSGKFPQAQSALQEMIGLFPKAPEVCEALWRLGEAYESKKDFASAVRTFDALLSRDPQHTRAPEALTHKGNALRASGDSKGAIDSYAQVVERYPQSAVAPEAAKGAGEIFAKNGDKARAAEYFEKSASLGLGTYLGHAAQVELNDLLGRPNPSLPHEVGAPAPLVAPVNGIERTNHLANELKNDERIQRLEFFAAHGMPEAEWEVLGLWETLRASANPDPWFEAIAQAGTAYSVMQMAEARSWGIDEAGVLTAERQRVRFPLAYWQLVRQLADETGVDPYLILAVARQESTYRPALTSYAGAQGVMQVMPATADWLVKVEEAVPANAASELDNPQVSLRLGTYYLMRMLERSNGNVPLALASYNAGPGNCDKWKRRLGNVATEKFVEQIPFDETRTYVKNVLGYYAAYHSLYATRIAE